jgi:excisionase family DNA binding protein
MAQRRRYVKIGEAADYLGVNERTIRNMISDGRLTAYRGGARLIRIDLDELDAAMKPYGGAV